MTINVLSLNVHLTTPIKTIWSHFYSIYYFFLKRKTARHMIETLFFIITELLFQYFNILAKRTIFTASMM